MNADFKIISLVDFSESELESVFTLYNKNFPESPWSKKFFQSYLFSQSQEALGFLLKVNDVLAGFVFGKISPASDSFNISSLWISQEYRGQAYGKVLIAIIIKEISKKASTKNIFLHFREKNKLKNYYEKLGFVNAGADIAYSNGEPRHKMILKINNLS